MDLLAEAGYARLTMDQVAARAGVGKASLYLRWPNKVALVAEAIQHRSAVVPDVPRHREPARGYADVPAGAAAREGSRGNGRLAAVTGEIASNPELRQAWRQSMEGTLSACVRQIVEHAIARGSCQPPATWSCWRCCR